ncbi:MAG: DUF2155 domain-containing protein [Pseudomonadota bacterium]
MRRRLFWVLACACLLSLASGRPALAEPTGALLQGLDKISAKTFAFEAPFNRPIRFGHLEVIVRACHAKVRAAAPERTAFLEVYEAKDGEARKKVFSGWMFASAPSVSAMEHPVFDVWVVGCAGVPGDSLNKAVPVLEALEDEEAPDENAPIPED